MCDVCLLWHDTKTLLVTKIFKNSLWLIISRWHFPKFITMPCKEFSVYCSPSELHGKPRLVCSNIKPPRFFYYRATCLSDAVFPEAERQIRQTQRASELLFTALMRCEKQSKKKKKETAPNDTLKLLWGADAEPRAIDRVQTIYYFLCANIYLSYRVFLYRVSELKNILIPPLNA